MQITDQELQAVNQLGFIASRVDDLKHLTKGQWIALAGYALTGAAVGFATGGYVVAGLGALGGVAAHLGPLMSSSPHDKAMADQVVKAEAAKGAAEVAKADPAKPAAQAAADFAKEMKS